MRTLEEKKEIIKKLHNRLNRLGIYFDQISDYRIALDDEEYYLSLSSKKRRHKYSSDFLYNVGVNNRTGNFLVYIIDEDRIFKMKVTKPVSLIKLVPPDFKYSKAKIEEIL